MTAEVGIGGLLGAPVQIAYAVPDATTAAAAWAGDLGAGPFFVRPRIELVDVVYRGRPGTFDHTSAYGQWGSLMVELVADHGRGDSPIRDMFAPGESGLHHLAFIVDDLDETMKALVRAGYEIAMSARTTNGTEFHFVDTRPTYGHMVELYERSDRLRDFYGMVARAAEGWTGDEPVRMLASGSRGRSPSQ
ncbi:MAG TPA: VOC family protein [Ilumatobacteraceae bacterium]|nr:VOC family protein [Ilumatobacteraceae bacterium]